MKIILPVNEENLESGICVSFGRAPYFMLWNTEDQVATFVENPGASSSGGAGIQAAQAVADQKADCLIVPRIGKNASDVIEQASIKIYQSTTTNIMENIQWLIEEKLSILTDIHPGFHNHGDQE